jgi:hypothetical protein
LSTLVWGRRRAVRRRGLEVFGSVALLRSLAVAPEARGLGHGKTLVDSIEGYARGLGVTELYLLTTTARPFFESLGYALADRSAAPESIRATREFSSICPGSAAFLVKRLAAPIALSRARDMLPPRQPRDDGSRSLRVDGDARTHGAEADDENGQATQSTVRPRHGRVVSPADRASNRKTGTHEAAQKRRRLKRGSGRNQEEGQGIPNSTARAASTGSRSIAERQAVEGVSCGAPSAPMRGRRWITATTTSAADATWRANRFTGSRRRAGS